MLVIRAPNHLGDFVMALPALNAVQPDRVILPRWLEPLGKLAGFNTLPFDRGGRGFSRAVVELRRSRFSRGVLLTPSFSSALMLRLGGVRMRRGTDTDGRSLLLTSIVSRSLVALNHRSSIYVMLATGDLPGERPVPALRVREKPESGKGVRPTFRRIGLFPGSNAPSRTWDATRFAAVAQTLSRDAEVIVFGGPTETARTRTVAGNWALDMGGKTDLPALAAGLASCDLVISNDSGPLHLAAAVGTKTISLWGAGNPAETGPPDGHIILRHTELPCLECVRNQCPRRGKGYILPDAYNECLQLITVEQVVAAARSIMAN